MYNLFITTPLYKGSYDESYDPEDSGIVEEEDVTVNDGLRIINLVFESQLMTLLFRYHTQLWSRSQVGDFCCRNIVGGK